MPQGRGGRTSSELYGGPGVHFDVASAAGPPMFRIVSALCPHYSRSLSAPFPQHLRNLSALFPRYFRIAKVKRGNSGHSLTSTSLLEHSAKSTQ